MVLLEEYVSRIYEACGEGKDFIVVLKYAKREEATRRILAKCEAKRMLSRVLTLCEYKGKEISVSITGKLVVKGSEGAKNVEAVLEELLK